MKWKILTAATLLFAFASFALAAPAPQTPQTKQGTQNSNPANSSQNSMGGHTVTVNGTKIFYRVSGHGEPLILMHGYPLDDQLFMKQRQHLASHFKVITPDLPGFGQSGTLHGKASLKAYAKDMFGMMDKLGIKKAVIGGHSMGGMTTIEMYKMHPNRFAGMILIDTAAIAAPLPNKMLWEGYAKLAKTKNNYKKTMIMLLGPLMLTGETRMQNKQLMSNYKAMIMAASKKGVIGGAMALAKRPDNRSVLKKVDVPTLILVGKDDPLTPYEIAQNMHKAVKGSTLAIINNGSHAEILAQANKADQAIMQWAQSAHLMSKSSNNQARQY